MEHPKNSDATVTNRFVKGLLSTSAGSMISIVFGFVNILIAVRYVTKSDLGAYLLIQVIVLSAVMVSDLGLNMSATKYIACCAGPRKHSAINTLCMIRIGTAIAVTAILLLCSGILGKVFNLGNVAAVIYYIPVLYVFEFFYGSLMAVLQGHHYYKKMAAAQVILSLLCFALVLVFTVKLHMGLYGLIYARIFSLAFSFAYQILAVPVKLSFTFDKAVCKEMFAFGFPLGLNNILHYIFMKFDTLMIGVLLNPVGVASYGTASKIPDASRQLFESFRSVFFPNMSELFAQKRHVEAETVMNNCLRLISFVTGLTALVVIMFQYQIVRLFFTAQYAESAPVLSVLMLALGIGLLGNIMGTSLISAGFSKVPVIINIVDAVVNVTANLLLLPRFGVMGAAYAALLSRVVTNPVNVWFAKKHNIQVRVSEYAKPIFILGICLAVYKLFDHQGVIFDLLIILLYIGLSTGLSVISVLDVKRAIKELQFSSI